jgi:hypothetical protein
MAAHSHGPTTRILPTLFCAPSTSTYRSRVMTARARGCSDPQAARSDAVRVECPRAPTDPQRGGGAAAARRACRARCRVGGAFVHSDVVPSRRLNRSSHAPHARTLRALATHLTQHKLACTCIRIFRRAGLRKARRGSHRPQQLQRRRVPAGAERVRDAAGELPEPHAPAGRRGLAGT